MSGRHLRLSVSSSVKQKAGRSEEPGWWSAWCRTVPGGTWHLTPEYAVGSNSGLDPTHLPSEPGPVFLSLSEPQLPHLYHGAPTVPDPLQDGSRMP